MTTSYRRGDKSTPVSSSLIASVRGRHLAVAAAVYMPLAILMFGQWAGSLAAVRRTCNGLSAFDVRGWWTVQDARTMLTACGPTGRTAYLHQQILDLAYPAALVALLLVATALVVRRYGNRWWPVLLPAVAMTVLDYVENAGIWTLLLDWPDTNSMVITVAGAATAVKRILGFIAFSMPLLLALATLISTIRRRGRRTSFVNQVPIAHQPEPATSR
jgi:hypothetical protein